MLSPQTPARRPRGVAAPLGLRWIAAAALALAGLRFVALGRWGLWIDEALSLHDALAFEWARPSTHPLGHWLTARALEFGGAAPSEALLRVGPALFGVLGLALTAWCFAPLLGRRRALVAALLVGLSSWHLYWSQCARAYTLAQALSLCGAGLVLRACLNGSLRVYVAGLAVALFAGLAHESALLLVPVLFLAPWLARAVGVEVRWRPPAWLVAAVFAGLALCAATWASDAWSTYQQRKGSGGVEHFVLSSGYLFGPALELAALVALVRAWRERDAGGRFAALACVLVLSMALAASLAVRVTAQYVFVLLPWVAALASGVVLSETARGGLGRAVTALVLVVGVADLTLYFSVRHGDRARWKEAYAYVARERGPDDLVFGMAGPVGEYYFAPRSGDLRGPGRVVRLTDFQEPMLHAWLRRERPIWIVVNREDLNDWRRERRERMDTFLSEQCEQVRVFRVAWTPRDLDVVVYRRP